MFPIALATAHSAGQPVRPFVLAVVVAASLSFLTPFGYQTNLIVAGLANYRARDFLPLGLVLMVVSLLATTAVLGLSLQ
jgi:di/tricarboxylate transporter